MSAESSFQNRDELIKIEKWDENTKEEFNKIMLDGFADKFEVFFKNIPHEKREKILLEMEEIAYPEEPDMGMHFIAMLEGKPVGAMRLIHKKLPSPRKWQSFRYLVKEVGFWKALRTGFLLDAFTLHLCKEKEVYIDALAVKSGYRGKGIGSALLRFSFQYARKLNAEFVSLYVAGTNPRAKKLYERMGFKVKKVRKTKVGEKLFDIPVFYFMIKTL